MSELQQRYAGKIVGAISCLDRVVISGSLPGLCYAEGMTRHLNARHIRIFDYARFAEPLRDRIRDNAAQIAQAHGLTIQFLRKARTTRKERVVADVIKHRGTEPGLVCILSAMERCPTYKPWFDKNHKRALLRPAQGKCLHYYFYFIDPDYGLGYVRVPTWCPFRLQIYFNGHGYLAAQLSKKAIEHRLLDNALVKTNDFASAQHLADQLDIRKLHRFLDRLAARCCPVLYDLGLNYHWSLMQVEFATDIIFRSKKDLAPVYESLTRAAVLAVKANQVATFLGRKLNGNFLRELGSDFSTRVEGIRIRHHMGPASIKMYDKFGFILRIETTTNDVSFFRHHRQVEQRDGTLAFKLAPLKKSIYSLHTLRRLFLAANQRYLDFLSSLDNPQQGIVALDKVSRPVRENGRGYKGFNFFSADDLQALQAVIAGQYVIRGFRSRDLIKQLPRLSPSQRSRLIKRLRIHGLIKKVAHTYKYYLSALGKRVIAAGLQIKALFLQPALCPKLIANG
jgi:hypothetical protein